MEFSYQLTWEVWKDARLTLMRARLRKAAVPLILLFFCILNLILLEQSSGGACQNRDLLSCVADRSIAPLVELAGVFLVLPLLVYVLLYRRLGRIYRDLPGKDGPVHVTVTADLVEVDIPNVGRSSFRWSYYKSWSEGKRTFLLKLRTGQAQFLPKTALSETQIAEVRSILAAALQRK